MSTDIAVKQNNAVANYDFNVDAFEDYGSQVQRTIIGKLLRFNKGDWMLGQENVEVPMGTKYVAIMNEYLLGWVKWEDNKPSQQLIGRLSDGYRPLPRKDLGDLDETLWDVDDQGRPRDPWQEQTILLLRPVGLTEQPDEDHLVTFIASSKGGRTACQDLAKAFSKGWRLEPNRWPVIELGVSKYKHPNASYGFIKTPTLTIVGWEPVNPALNLAAPEEPKMPAKKGK